MVKSKSGGKGALFSGALGALIQGAGVTPLADNSWFLVEARATAGTQLPFGIGYLFKTGTAASAITPIVGDDVYPVTFTKICTVDVSWATSLGTIEVTDSCSDGQIKMIPDGFVDFSGSAAGFLKFEYTDGAITSTQKTILGEHFETQTDSGAGVYVSTAKGDGFIILAYLQDTTRIAEDDVQEWILGEVIITAITLGKPLKGVQSLDLTFAKGENPVVLYARTTNATETVF